MWEGSGCTERAGCRDQPGHPPAGPAEGMGWGLVALAAEFAEFGSQFLEFLLEPVDLMGGGFGLLGVRHLDLVRTFAMLTFLANLAENLLGLVHQFAGEVVFFGQLEILGGDPQVVGPAFGLFEIGVCSTGRVWVLGGGAPPGVAAEFLQGLLGLGDLFAEFDEGLFFGTRLLEVAFLVAECLEALCEFCLFPFVGGAAFGLGTVFQFFSPGLEFVGLAFEAFGFVGATFAGGGFGGLEHRLGFLPEFVDFPAGHTRPASGQQHCQQHPRRAAEHQQNLAGDQVGETRDEQRGARSRDRGRPA